MATTASFKSGAPIPPAVAELRAIFAADPSRGRDSNGAWDEAWKRNVTPWDHADIQPALKELVEEKWEEATGSPWESLVGGEALVAGCGRGYDATYFAAKGLKALGMDLSPTAIEAAKAHLAATDNPPSNVEFKALDFFDFEPPKGLYDLAYDWTFLAALPPDFRAPWGRRYGEVIKPGGLLIALMWPIVGDRPGGPPWSVSPEAYEEVLGADFERIYFAAPTKGDRAGKGEEMISVWRRK